jgi:hypothetical protein
LVVGSLQLVVVYQPTLRNFPQERKYQINFFFERKAKNISYQPKYIGTRILFSLKTANWGTSLLF